LTAGARSIGVWCLASQVEKNLRAAMREALRIQDRFVPEPLFAKTGRGYLMSEGVPPRKKSNPISGAKLRPGQNETAVAEGLGVPSH
jgi:hypothetical protein